MLSGPLTPSLRIHMPRHPSSHPTSAEVMLDMPWLKHPPTMQRHRAHLVPLALTLTLQSCHSWQVALHQRGTGPWQHLSAKPLSPWVSPLQDGDGQESLTIQPQHSWEASRLCLAQGPLLSQRKQEICWERGPAPSRVEEPGAGQPWRFILVSPKQITCPLRRHFKQHLLEVLKTVKNTNNHIKKNKTKSSRLKKKTT